MIRAIGRILCPVQIILCGTTSRPLPLPKEHQHTRCVKFPSPPHKHDNGNQYNRYYNCKVVKVVIHKDLFQNTSRAISQAVMPISANLLAGMMPAQIMMFFSLEVGGEGGAACVGTPGLKKRFRSFGLDCWATEGNWALGGSSWSCGTVG